MCNENVPAAYDLQLYCLHCGSELETESHWQQQPPQVVHVRACSNCRKKDNRALIDDNFKLQQRIRQLEDHLKLYTARHRGNFAETVKSRQPDQRDKPRSAISLERRGIDESPVKIVSRLESHTDMPATRKYEIMLHHDRNRDVVIFEAVPEDGGTKLTTEVSWEFLALELAKLVEIGNKSIKEGIHLPKDTPITRQLSENQKGE